MEERKRMILPVIGAVIAAFIGGIIWATIAILTKYELGIIAWGIGGLTGYTVAKLANKQTTQIHQIIAVIASLIGILWGKYIIISYILNDGFKGIMTSETLQFFNVNFTGLFNGLDVVIILFAVVTAWKLPSKVNQQKHSQPRKSLF